MFRHLPTLSGHQYTAMTTNSNKFTWCMVMLSLSLVACHTNGPISPTPRTKKNPSAAVMEVALSPADYAHSAQDYLLLAERHPPPQAYEYELLAADMLVQAHDMSTAQALLDNMPLDELPPRLKHLFYIVKANLHLQQHQPEQALLLLQTFQEASHYPLSLQSRLFEIRAIAYAQTQHYLPSVLERYALSEVLTDSARLHSNWQALWETLQQVPPSLLIQALQQPQPDDLKGWLELALIPASDQRAQMAWQNHFPYHPGQRWITTKIKAKAPAASPKQVALLLPMQGAHAQAAQAIRDGFLAQFYQNTPSPMVKPKIKIYDTSATASDIRTLYQQALAEGAEFVVGPLTKAHVYQLSQSSSKQLQVPILALNQHDEIKVLANFYQYALAPEGEAIEVAKKAWAAGHKNVLVVVPDNKWGQRVAEAFRQYWQTLGGHTLQTAYVDPLQDQALAIQKLLNFDSSKARTDKIKQMLKEKIEIVPRRRQDVDFIFLATSPEQARQIRPLFEFYYANQVPVYATSSIYSGQPNPKQDQDMNGIYFCDMPWLIEPTTNAEKSLQAKAQSPQYTRLYAMGMDAYRLVFEVQRLAQEPEQGLQGATGYLSVDQRHLIQRELRWARIRHGLIQPIY